MIEPAVRLERAEERLLERVVGALAPEATPQEAHDLGAMLFVEALERGDRHRVHHSLSTPKPAHL